MSGRVLLRFSKRSALKYTGHLDLLRVFQRVVRRAGLPAAYSQGFNPHMRLTFALPLPVGMESVDDYAELVLAETPPPEEIMARINACGPAGLTVTGAWYLPEGTANAASRTAAADYQADLAGWIKSNGAADDGGAAGINALRAAVQAVLDEPAVVIPKKTKSGVKDADIRPDIYALRLDGEPLQDPAPQRDGEPLRDPAPRRETAAHKLYMRLSAGSASFLHPKYVLQVLEERLPPSVRGGAAGGLSESPLIRLALYGGHFMPLYAYDGAACAARPPAPRPETPR